MKPNFKALGFFLFVLILWQAIGSFNLVSEILFPSPLAVFNALIQWLVSGELLVDILSSFWRLIAGLIIGIAFGIVFGLLVGRIFFLEETITLFFHILRSFPPVAIIPLVIVWFGIGDFAKIFSISFAVFFPVWISAYVGTKQINQDYLKVAKLFSKSFKKTLSKVVFPATLPFLISGIRIAIGVAYIMIFVSELAGASSGLGYRIANAQQIYRTDILIAGLFVLGSIAAITDFVFVFFSKKFFPWVELK